MKKKRNHKTAMKIQYGEVRTRKTWNFDPSTRVEADKKKYNRLQFKKETRKEMYYAA